MVTDGLTDTSPHRTDAARRRPGPRPRTAWPMAGHDESERRRTAMADNVLVAYATKNGSTAEIAEAVAEVFRKGGLTAEAVPARSVTDLASYDAVVLGGGLYAGRWHKDARRFVRRHRRALTERPVWFFSSGPLDASASEREIPPVPGIPRSWSVRLGRDTGPRHQGGHRRHRARRRCHDLRQGPSHPQGRRARGAPRDGAGTRGRRRDRRGGWRRACGATRGPGSGLLHQRLRAVPFLP